jgi:hypothetical protein
MPLFGGLSAPIRGFFIALRDAFAANIHQTKAVLRFSVSLFRSPPVPIRGFRIVLSNTTSVHAQPPHTVLRFGMPLFGGLPVPVHCLNIILRRAFPVKIHPSEILLRFGVSAHCKPYDLFDIRHELKSRCQLILLFRPLGIEKKKKVGVTHRFISV